MKRIFNLSPIAVVLLVLGLQSCRKERDHDLDTSAATDNALAENSFNELKNIADEAYAGTMVVYRDIMDTLIYGCATVIRDTMGPGKTITVDFGPTNCMCNDGKNRRGKVVSTYTGMYRDSGTVIVHTPDNYYVNDNQLVGSKTVSNKGHNANGNLWYEIDVNGQVVKGTGGTINWVSHREREWIEGGTTSDWYDDAYLITGTASGTRANGETFTALTILPLRKEIGCAHFVSGSIEVTPANHPVRLIDFGTGTCDNVATVTVDGRTFTVTLQ